jgi:type IV pilus assembly protein PilV
VNRSNYQSGTTLIEVLITIVVVSIGLLGMAALQLKSVAVNQVAYQRLQATNLAYEIADSIALNPAEAEAGNYTIVRADTSPQNAVVGSVADIDLKRWIEAVDKRLPEGDLIIGAPVQLAGTGGDAWEYLITICWYDKTQEDLIADCGVNQTALRFSASSRM